MVEYVAVGTRVWRLSPAGNICVGEYATVAEAQAAAIEMALAEHYTKS